MLPNKTNEPQEALADHWDGILPDHIDSWDVENLISTIEEQLEDSPVIRDALEACSLQPTTRACWLAANSAVLVLLAHEIGQEVAADSAKINDEPEEPCDFPGCNKPSLPNDIWCADHRRLEDSRR